MAEPANWLLIVTAEIDDAVEEDWNRWYDETHLPEALACPGMISGRRYLSQGTASLTDHGERTNATTPIYVAIYEIEGPHVLETAEFRAMRGWYQFSDRIRARTQVFRGLSG